MKNKSVTYLDHDQRLIGEFFYHEHDEKKPTIILFPAFEGRGEFALDYAKKIAQQDYHVFVADMYGDGVVAQTIDDCFALIKPFLNDRTLVRRRAELAFQTVLQQEGIDSQKIGAVGFCFGGMCLLELARSGAALHAGVIMHGVLAKSDLLTQAIQTKLLLLQGYADPQVPPEQLHAFADEMQKANCQDWIFTFFGDAKHSFTDPKTGTFDAQKEKEMGREYNKRVADYAYRAAIDFFKQELQHQ